MAAESQDRLTRARRETAIVTSAVATMIAHVVCGGPKVLLLSAIIDSKAGAMPSRALDLFVTGLVVGAGIKPLHDLVSNMQKASNDKTDAPAKMSAGRPRIGPPPADARVAVFRGPDLNATRMPGGAAMSAPAPWRGAANSAGTAGTLAAMRVPVLLPHHDVEHIACPGCGELAVLVNSPRRRRREWACPSCRAAGTVRVAGRPTRHRPTPTGHPLTPA